MKMKVLDCALLGLFSGVASSAWAPALADTPAMASTRCNETGCSHPDGLLFRLQSRGEREPVTSGTPPRASDAALQPDRRATIELLHTGAPVPGAVPGKATAVGKFSVSLPDGGVIWATEDPTLGLPELSVSAPALVAFDAGRITQPVQVFVRSNYPGFIQRYELSFYRALDTARVEPLATVAVPVAAVSGPWFDSATTFAAAQVRYELPAQWQAMAEYRVLAVKNGGTRSGWLVGVDRDIAPSLRLGVGYNFTSFSDDLTRLDYRYRGFFINLVGSY